MIVYLMSAVHCQNLVTLTNKHNVVLVPYAGCTNVSWALLLPLNEKFMIVSVDMTYMNAIMLVDKEKNVACVQAGVIGANFERYLKQYGVISNHEPDSAWLLDQHKFKWYEKEHLRHH
jgi:FAD/FMN-containing dehydrogenase